MYEKIYAICNRAGSPITYIDVAYDGWPRQLILDPKIKVISLLISKKEIYNENIYNNKNNKHKISAETIKILKASVYVRELVFKF